MTAAAPTPSLPARIAFIGGGNMARSLVGGLIAAGVDAARIQVAEPDAATAEALRADFGIHVVADAADAVAGADTWLMAVKPQVMRAVCQSLADAARRQQPLVVSIAAGITSAQIARWLGAALPIVRAMPNTPALLGAGASGLYANAAVDADGRARAQALLDTAGSTVWLDDEALMDAVTAVSGSGPAYVFLLAEAMEHAAISEGLGADAARMLVVQTISGAARMLAESGLPADELRRRVTSPGGTTQAALDTFAAGGFAPLVGQAIARARLRGAELSAAHHD